MSNKNILVKALVVVTCLFMATTALAQPCCQGDTYGINGVPDGKVTGWDLNLFKQDYGRMDCPPSPIWQIFAAGTDESVSWVDAVNPRFTVYGNVVLDKETGLVWEKTPSTPTMDWYSAQSNCYTKQVSGRRGWRLPTVEELASLVDTSQSNPSLPSGHPFTVQSSYYWTATTYATNTADAWFVYFYGGSVLYGDKYANVYVWCVRGGHGYDAY